MYVADVSTSLVSKFTGTVLEQVIESKSRPLDQVYPFVYLDCIVVKIRQGKQVINKSVYLALGINMKSHLLSDPGSVRDKHSAHQKVATGPEPLYDYVFEDRPSDFM